MDKTFLFALLLVVCAGLALQFAMERRRRHRPGYAGPPPEQPLWHPLADEPLAIESAAASAERPQPYQELAPTALEQWLESSGPDNELDLTSDEHLADRGGDMCGPEI